MADDIAPLGFAIDTGALDKAAEAADKAAGSLKAIGTSGGEAQKGLDAVNKGAGDSAKSLNDQADAADKAAKANAAHAESLDKVKNAQAALAAAPAPTPMTMQPGINNTPAPPKPVQAKSGGYYQNQEMADWADAQEAKHPRLNRENVPAFGAITGEPTLFASSADDMRAQNASRRQRWATQGTGKGGASEAAEEAKDLADAAGDAEKGVTRMASGMGLANIAAGALGGILGGVALTAIIGLGKASLSAADDGELLERRLNAITGSATAAESAIQGATRAAAASGTLNSAQTGLRTGLSRAALDVGGSERDQFGSTLAQIDQLGGNKAGDFAKLGGSISTAFKDGRVELGELNDLLDQSPELASKLADGLKMPIDSIKQMAAEGRFFADDFIRGINRTDEETRGEFASMKRTGEQSFTDLSRAADGFFETLGKSLGLQSVTSAITSAITKGFSDADEAIKANGIFGYMLRGGANTAGLQAAGARIRANREGGDAEETQLTNMRARQMARQAGRDPDDISGASSDSGALAQWLKDNYDTRITSTDRDPNSRLGRANPNSYHNVGKAVDFSPPAGVTIESIKAAAEAAGFTINEALDEVKNPSAHATGPHFHIAGTRSASTSGEASVRETGQGLLATGADSQITKIEGDLAAARTTGNATLISELENRLRTARASRDRLNETPFSRASATASDRETYRDNPIGLNAATANRAGTDLGYGSDFAGYLDLGIRGAVVGAGNTTDRLRQQGSAERDHASAIMRGQGEQDEAQIKAQTAEFRRQNFGDLEDGRITKAVDDYRAALTELKKAQRESADAQQILNAQTKAGVENAAIGALGAGQRGYAVDQARQNAEEAALRRDGRDTTASRLNFDTRNRSAYAERSAAANDNADADGRYMGIGSDAYSRRQFGRSEQVREAGQGYNGVAASIQTALSQGREDEKARKDREDADTESVRSAERQLTLAGLYGQERRNAVAVLERENQLISQGLLPAGDHLTASEKARVEATAERLRLINEEVQRAEELANIGANAGKSVGDGLRGVFSDLFTDGKVKVEDLAKAAQGIVSRIGTNIADVLIIRPIERATEKFADMAVDGIMGAVGGGRGGKGRGGASVASAAVGGAKDAASGAAKAAADAKGAVAANASAAATGKMAITTATATGALATFTKAVISAAAAAGADGTKKTVAAVVSAAAKPHAFGDALGGVGDSPTLFPMASGMGLAFEAGPEAVLPLKRGADGRLGVAANDGGGGGGGVGIVVNDMRGAGSPDVETTQSQGPDGRRMISMTIRGETKSAIKSGEMDGAMRDTYGIARQVRRA